MWSCDILGNYDVIPICAAVKLIIVYLLLLRFDHACVEM